MEYPNHSKAVEIEAFLRPLIPIKKNEYRLADSICSSPKETLSEYGDLIEDPYVRGDFMFALFEAQNASNDDDSFLDEIYLYVKTARIKSYRD